jgi:hypothetical protein
VPATDTLGLVLLSSLKAIVLAVAAVAMIFAASSTGRKLSQFFDQTKATETGEP